MSAISSVLLVHSDQRVASGLRFGFEREGVAVTAPDAQADLSKAMSGDAQIVVTGGDSKSQALSVLGKIRAAREQSGADLPVLYIGNGISRQQALDEGASEVLAQPAFVRDVVTMARILCGPLKELTSALTGELGDHFGLFYIVRALSRVQRDGVLTLVRGLRRGELRFFEGELTSAQAGVLHGVSAFHQLLLWTDARFELRQENVVRRQQIPLSPTELLSNAEDFLRDFREIAGRMSPSAVLQIAPGDHEEATERAPAEVRDVLRLFDGARSLADVLEDSPYRMFETLRIANRLEELGTIKMRTPKKRAQRAALSIEEWLVGDPAPSAPEEVTATESEPIGPPPGEPASPPRRKKKKKKKKRKKPDGEPVAASTPSPKVDWGPLLPQRSSGDAFSQVVPSSVASGEISSPAARKEPSILSGQPAVVTGPPEAIDTLETEPVKVDSDARDEDGGDWSGDTEPIDEQALDEEEGAPRPRSVTASGEIQLPELPAFLRAQSEPLAVAEGVVVESESQRDTDETDRVPEAAISHREAEAAARSKALAEAAARAKAEAEAKSKALAEAAAKAKAEAEAKSKALAEAASRSKAEAAAKSKADKRSKAKSKKKRKRAPTAPPELEQMAASNARDAAEAIAAAVRHRPPTEPGRAGSESDVSQPDIANRLAGKEAGRVAAAAAKAADTAFTSTEEEFFNAGKKISTTPSINVESFEDLDEEYELPKTFWQRLMARPGEAPAKKGKK